MATKAAEDEKPILANDDAAPFEEPEEDYEYIGLEEEEEGREVVFATCGCGFYRDSCFRWKRSKNNNGLLGKLLQQQQHRCNYSEELGTECRKEKEEDQSWWMKRCKKLKETKWKSFIRKLRCKNRKRSNKVHFQYDQQSYALNFDSGDDREEDDCSARGLDFAARFAAPARPVRAEKSGIKS